MNKLPVRKAVGVVIRCSRLPQHLLLVKKVKQEDISKRNITPEWDLPKGGMKTGEIEEQTVWRELEEELGSINFQLVGKLPININFNFPELSNAKYSGQQTSLYLIDYHGTVEELKPNSTEIGEIKAVHLDEIHKFVKFEETLNAIKKMRLKSIL